MVVWSSPRLSGIGEAKHLKELWAGSGRGPVEFRGKTRRLPRRESEKWLPLPQLARRCGGRLHGKKITVSFPGPHVHNKDLSNVVHTSTPSVPIRTGVNGRSPCRESRRQEHGIECVRELPVGQNLQDPQKLHAPLQPGEGGQQEEWLGLGWGGQTYRGK